MSLLTLVLRSASYHWRTNLAVLLGVAAAVAVLGGALLVGESVRASLRELAFGRLGRTDQAIASTGFFAGDLAERVRVRGGGAAAPLIVSSGFVTFEASGRRAGNVLVYGVDEAFWAFHGVAAPEGPAISPALAAELGLTAEGEDRTLLVRLQRPSEIPIESLFGRKDEIGRTIRLTVAEVLPRERMGEFSLRPQQAELRAVFAPLRRIQRDLGVGERVNTVLLAGLADAEALAAARAALSLEDLGVTVRASADGGHVIVDSSSGILDESLENSIRETAGMLGLAEVPVFTYLANTMRVGGREVPYSLVTATRLERVPGEKWTDSPNPVVLNAWAARELDARPGDSLEIEYYRWDANAGLTTHTAAFTVAGTTPIVGLAADRNLAPEYPGITGSDSLADWDPPFPIELARVRAEDEAYWDEYRTTPKAFIPFERGRDLWQTRYGGATSVRLVVPAGDTAEALAARVSSELARSVRPETQGVTVQPVRSVAAQASHGATDFGEYFTYFSFFIVVSAVLLAVLFFRLGVEQRLRQIGIMRAAGYGVSTIRRLLMIEGVALAAVGGVLGIAGAIGYAHVIVYGLRTWWVGAVGTTQLSLHVAAAPLALGAAGGVAAAALSVLLALRWVARVSPRALLTAQAIGGEPLADSRTARRHRLLGAALGVLAATTIVVGLVRNEAQAAAFFAAGGASLVAALYLLSAWLRSRPSSVIAGRGTAAVLRLGFRSAAFRPGRSVLSAALIAAAAFIIVSVDAFRKGGGEVAAARSAGTGGYALVATTEIPLLHDPNDPAGREALVVSGPEFDRARFTRFRVRPGDDASCLNLYRPQSPTIVAPESRFIEEGRFTFAASLAETDEERANPWRLLRRSADGGPIPVIADATSLQYVLHAKVGDVFSMDVGADAPIELQFVGALKDSILQAELVMAEEHFVRLFPAQQGYRYFLIDAPGVESIDAAGQLAGALEAQLATFGFDAVTAVERLEAFHRVENTYLSTFQSLGALGLLLGTVGLAAVLFRNVLERRRELALLRVVGYDRRRVSQMILAEAVLLLGAGLGAGVLSAVVAVVPAWTAHGGGGPGGMLGLLLLAVAAAAVLSAFIAARAALAGGMLDALRAE
ncbi:MAG TPA: ABC transporter permease [Vicinamibacterales bacterium]|nr:ABC transporter permease [Vicinamibacterales bacterium]